MSHFLAHAQTLPQPPTGLDFKWCALDSCRPCYKISYDAYFVLAHLACSHRVSHTFVSSPLVLLTAILTAVEAYEGVAKRSRVNADKKRKYLRGIFIQKFLEKQDIFVTEAYVANSVKALDRRQSKKVARKSSVCKSNVSWGECTERLYETFP